MVYTFWMKIGLAVWSESWADSASILFQISYSFWPRCIGHRLALKFRANGIYRWFQRILQEQKMQYKVTSCTGKDGPRYMTHTRASPQSFDWGTDSDWGDGFRWIKTTTPEFRFLLTFHPLYCWKYWKIWNFWQIFRNQFFSLKIVISGGSPQNFKQGGRVPRPPFPPVAMLMDTCTHMHYISHKTMQAYKLETQHASPPSHSHCFLHCK